MLGLCALVLAAGMGLGTLGNPEHRSYLLALLLGCLCAAVLCWLRARSLPRLSGLLEGSAGKSCALLALLCAALHLTWVLAFRLEPSGDYATFYNTAADLARGQPLRSAEYVAMFPHILGYAAFLSLFMRLFGVSALAASVLNVLLTTASGVLLYRLCLRWWGKRAALIAFALWILCPSKLLYNTMVLSEPFYTCLLLLFLTLLSALERRLPEKRGRLQRFGLWGLAAGVLLRMLNAARPVAAVPILALLIWLLLLRGRAQRKGSFGPWALFVCLLVLSYAASGTAWDAYARSVLGETPAAMPGYNIYVGFNEESGGSYSTEDAELLMHYRYEVYGNAAQAQEKMLQEAEGRIRSGQIDFGSLLARKLRTFLGNDEGGAYYSRLRMDARQYALWSAASNVYFYALVLLSLAGCLWLCREEERRCILLAPLYVLGLTLAQMLVEVAGRYHYSILPMLILLAAAFLGSEVPQKTRR